MFRYTFEYYKSVDGEEVPTEIEAAAPFVDRCTLDETLDLSLLDLYDTDIAEAFEPFTKFKITIVNEETGSKKEIYRYLSHDTTELTRMAEPFRYKHSLTLIEPTKILEREVCDNLTFTNTLLAQQNAVPADVIPSERFERYAPVSITKCRYEYPTDRRYQSPLSTENTFEILPVDIYTCVSGTWNKKPVSAGMVGITIEGKNIARETYVGETLSLAPGSYIVTYRYPKNKGQLLYEVKFSTYLYDSASPPKRQSVAEEIARLLAVTPLRREGVQNQKYRLSEGFLAQYGSVEAPEFTITAKTLFEALMQFGGYIHAIPYLKVSDNDWITINFMPLDSREEAEIQEQLSACTEEKDIGQYCSCIDCVAENIINADNEAQGTITEPYEGGYMSMRAAGGELEISEDTAALVTGKPIYKVISLEAGLEVGKMVDISGRVLEKAQYDLLSSYDDAPNGSKAYSIYYTQGQNGIHGIGFKQPTLGPDAWKNCAIVNILNKEGIVCSNADLPRMKFRIRYIPFVNMRVRQYKTNARDIRANSVMIYNQQANVLDSLAYGENLKGTVAKLGNAEPNKTYFFRDFMDVPKVGSLYQGYRVSRTETKYWQSYVESTVYFSKDYNKLAEEVGLKNQERFYEVSEKQSVQRHCNYGEFCLIGDDVSEQEAGITEHGAEAFRQLFLQADANYRPASCVVAQGVAENELTKTLLPASSLANGNSIAVYFGYADNFSAGNQSVKDGYRDNRIQQSVPYCDAYGAITKLRVAVYAGIDQTSDDIAFALPELTGSVSGLRYFNYWDRPFLMYKDNREVPDITMQIHTLQNRPEIVIGTAFAQNNPIVSGIAEKRVAKILFLPYTIGKFERRIEGGVQGDSNLADLIGRVGKKVRIAAMQAPVDCRSWALVSSDTNELILGFNEPLRAGELSKPVYLSFRSEVG